MATLEGGFQSVTQAAAIFMENSPSENRFRIEQLEGRVEDLEKPGSNPPEERPEVDTSAVIRRGH
ncbi:MAG: hypothetical protein GTO02_15125 [Candidatus Dadabacteria bacterium]|nr:hypothetical protein [Candidatus Dadabacteria bacterium]